MSEERRDRTNGEGDPGGVPSRLVVLAWCTMVMVVTGGGGAPGRMRGSFREWVDGLGWAGLAGL
jgi:hypothetical protein